MYLTLTLKINLTLEVQGAVVKALVLLILFACLTVNRDDRGFSICGHSVKECTDLLLHP